MTRLLTFDELRDHGVVWTRRHVDKLERVGKFPKRVPIGDHRVAWVEEEIDAFVDKRIKARSTAVGNLGSTGQKERRGAQGAPRPLKEAG